MRHTRIALLAWLVALPIAALAAAPPLDAFLAAAANDYVAIAPDGKHLAVTRRQGDKHMLTIFEFPAMKLVRAFSFGDENEAGTPVWANASSLIVAPVRQISREPGRTVAAGTGELFRADVSSNRAEPLWGQAKDGRRGAAGAMFAAAPRPLPVKTGKPGQVFVQMSDAPGFVGAEPGGVFVMELANGRMTRVSGTPLPFAEFTFGPDRTVTVATAVTLQNETAVYHMVRGEAARETTWTRQVVSHNDKGALRPVAWTGTGNEYYALDNRDAPTNGVVVWDAITNQQRLLYRHPDVDLEVAGRDADGRPWVFAGTDHYPVYWYPDPEHPLARMHRSLAQSLPNALIAVTSQTDDLSLAVVRVESAQLPPTFLIFDVRANRPVQQLAAYPDIKSSDLAPVEAIQFRARDGMNIRGYVTTPRGADGKPARKVPLVVLVHDGPVGVADDYRYLLERQLLAARGYAVLQVNFRGSGGRGREFLQAGRGEWGRKMADDIADGVRWAIQDGVADAARVCILGGRFGAFSALAAAAREPDLFKCAVGIEGMYDLPLYLAAMNPLMQQTGIDLQKEAVGDGADEARARSPSSTARSIKAKVLLLHGQQDQRTPIAHAARVREALTEAGNAPEWQVEGSDPQGFFGDKSRAEGYRKILDFIGKNIGS